MKNNLYKITITLILVLISILLLNPFYFWMPDMMVLLSMIIFFAIFISFIVRERDLNERDTSHGTLAGRNAFSGWLQYSYNRYCSSRIYSSRRSVPCCLIGCYDCGKDSYSDMER